MLDCATGIVATPPHNQEGPSRQQGQRHRGAGWSV